MGTIISELAASFIRVLAHVARPDQARRRIIDLEENFSQVIGNLPVGVAVFPMFTMQSDGQHLGVSQVRLALGSQLMLRRAGTR